MGSHGKPEQNTSGDDSPDDRFTSDELAELLSGNRSAPEGPAMVRFTRRPDTSGDEGSEPEPQSGR